uniref:uncharacterized protein LOC120955660 isoform X4 n=1 Tax=Anopheles coluzzii TaxID=1518534 RepID=UPI0020FF80F9|nr:uncharacterized protein LOC120955660 isoform X4 [Anopheles coluzzii]
MRKVWLLASVVLAFLDFVKSQEVARTLYSTRYDNLDIDTILASNRLVTNYVDCLLSRKPCPPEGKDLKRILPEALRTKCARCSPIQKENALKIITRLYYDYPDQYRALRERWDPSGEYHRRFEEYLRGLQFNQIGGSNGGSGVGNTVVSGGNDRPAPPPVVVNRFGDDDANGRPSVAPAVPVVPTTTTTTARPTTTVRQTRPATRQTTTRNTQRTTTRFITRLPPTPPPTPPRTTTTTTTRTPTILPQRPPPPPPLFAPLPAPAQQQPILPQATPPQQQYPSVVYQRPPAPPRASPPPPPVPQAPLTTSAPARPFYVQTEPPRTPPPPPQQQYPTVVYQRPQAPPRASPPPPPLSTSAPTRPYYVQTEPPRTPPPPLPPVQQQYPTVVYQRPQAAPPSPQAPARPFYVQPEPPATQYGQTTPDSIIDHFFVPPSSQAANQPLPPSPIVGLWNQLGTKIADTADAIAGMLKKTVDVLVTSHIQSHQRALRRIQ